MLIHCHLERPYMIELWQYDHQVSCNLSKISLTTWLLYCNQLHLCLLHKTNLSTVWSSVQLSNSTWSEAMYNIVHQQWVSSMAWTSTWQNCAKLLTEPSIYPCIWISSYHRLFINTYKANLILYKATIVEYSVKINSLIYEFANY